jgi:hypothetical protein
MTIYNLPQSPEEISERAERLGISKERLAQLLDNNSFNQPYEKISHKQKVMTNPNHHMTKAKNGKYYFCLKSKGVITSKPLCYDVEVSRKMRDEFLIEGNYKLLNDETNK